MLKLTEDFDNHHYPGCKDFYRGYLAIENGCFYFITQNLPPISVPKGAAILCHLSNKDIIKYEAGVLCKERISPYEN